MKRLVIDRTQSTLAVDFDPVGDKLVMSGESYPENSLKFFTPVLSWLDEYLACVNGQREVQVDLDIIYFNSSSSKALMNFFDRLEEGARKGLNISVVWRHHAENEIAFECGEEFGEDLDAARFCMLPYGDGGGNGA